MEERASQHSSLLKLAKWIHEGPAHGLRRQHRFSRRADGWSPTAKNTGIIDELGDGDELEGLDGISEEQLKALRFEHGCGGAPAYAQQ